jgi:HEAT repeat protein
LSGLDSVNWAELRHAYGLATDVPGLIRELASPDEETREEAYAMLFSNIYHQGTVYPASVAALPFLIELLALEATPDRASLALLVASLIGGMGFHQVHSAGTVKLAFAKPPDLDRLLAEEEVVTLGLTECGRAAIPLLLPFMKHESPDLRCQIAGALRRYRTDTAVIVPVLTDALAVEQDGEARSEIDAALAVLRPR